MTVVLTALLGLVAVGLLAWFVWRLLKLIWAFIGFILSSGGPVEPSSGGGDSRGSMNEGDFHSSPGGYEANTAYPDSHYGEFGRDEWGRRCVTENFDHTSGLGQLSPASG